MKKLTKISISALIVTALTASLIVIRKIVKKVKKSPYSDNMFI